MKKGSILINTGRGPLVNENDVAEALNEGEPPLENNLFSSAPNAYITLI